MTTNSDTEQAADERAWPSLRYYTDPPRYVVDGRLGTNGGKGGRRETFRTKEEANARRRQLREQMKRSGTEALDISTELRIEAVTCARQLAEKGATIRQATEHYLAYLAESSKSIPWREFFSKYLDSFYKWESKGRVLAVRKPHYDDVHQRVGRFAEWAGDRLVSDITSQQIDDWLSTLIVTKPGHPRHGLPLTEVSTRKIKNLLVGAYNYALDKGYAKINPARTNRKQQREKKERVGLGTSSDAAHAAKAEILWPEEYDALLRAAPDRLVPALLLQGFCGIRPSEAQRILWQHVDRKAKIVHIYPAVSKTHDYRTIPLRPILNAFLKKYYGQFSPESKIAPRSYREDLDRARDNARALLAAEGAQHGMLRWPDDCLRHGFASYYLAAGINDEQHLADEMGTSLSLIKSTYRQVTTAPLGKKYWSIKPAARA